MSDNGTLILTRAPGQRILIGTDVVVEVLEVRGNRVRLGFTAPLSVSIHREEVYERIKRGEKWEPKGESDG